MVGGGVGASGYGAAHEGGARWVGRAAILPGYEQAPDWVRHLALTICYYGLQAVWSTEMSQAAPYLLSLGLSKSMMSVVFLAGPLSGLLAQPIVGVFSDACKSTLGRRRPYMIAGCAVAATSMMMLGWSKSLAAIFVSRESSAHTTVTLAFAVFAIYALDFSINVVQAVDRSLLVDVVPPHLQADANAWASRMFGVGAVSGYWVGGLDLVYWTRGWLGDEQLKVLTLITTSLLIVCHLVTILCVRERVLISSTNGTNGRSSGSTWRVATLGVWHDIWHMMRNLPRPIRQLFHVQFCNWIGWFPVLFFSSTWVAETYVKAHSYDTIGESPPKIQLDATRAGSRAMLLHSLASLFASIIVPLIVAPSIPFESSRCDSSARRSRAHSFKRRIKRWLPCGQISWLTLELVWTFSNACFALLLFATWLASSVSFASVIVALMGFCWCITNWAPFSLLGDLILTIHGPSPGSLPIEDVALRRGLSPIAEADSSQEHIPLRPVPSDDDSRKTSTWERTHNASATTLMPQRSRGSLESQRSDGTAFFDAGSDADGEAQSQKGASGAELGPQEHATPMKSPATAHFSRNVAYEPYPNDDEAAQELDDSTPRILKVRHSDSIADSDSEAGESERSYGGHGRPARHDLSVSIDHEEQHGLGIGCSSMSRPSMSIYPEDLGGWQDTEALNDVREGATADRAGVILGCHNICIVMPQFLVTGISSLIFAILAPHHSVVPHSQPHGAGAIPAETMSVDAAAAVESVVATLMRRQSEDGDVFAEEAAEWDALGLVFRLAGISVAISAWLCWKFTKERRQTEGR